MSGIEVITEDLSSHPACPHGPTLLFSRNVKGENKKFYACSACRDRKDCSFFIWADDVDNINKTKADFWKTQCTKFLKDINHQKLFKIFHEVKLLSKSKRTYCHTCNKFIFPNKLTVHKEHNLESNIDNYKLSYPSKLLSCLESNKKEAQYLFSEKTVETVINLLRKNNLRNVLCIGTPTIAEYILNNCDDMSTLLLDIDKRYANFLGPLQFCWYNFFNHHFFLSSSKQIFEDFLKTEKGEGLVLVMDPPFGGRVEPMAYTLKTIQQQYKYLNKIQNDIPVLWFFPYFMEPHILNSLPEFQMLDYKVDYNNHCLFKDGPKGRKYGSPVRIFTNIDPSLIELPLEEGYRYCKLCSRWVSSENKHCEKCNLCTSKDGRTYTHCNMCERCVKPTWKHCKTCGRCAQPDHKCEQLEFSQECFHCKEKGHKKRDCPKVDHDELQAKRKKGIKDEKKKKKQKKE